MPTQQIGQVQLAQQAQQKQIPTFTLYDNDMVKADNGGWLLKWRIWDPNSQRSIWVKMPGEMMTWMGESYAEVLASAICKDFELENYTTYYPCVVIYKGIRILACYSYDFCEQNREKLITIKRLLEIYGKDSLVYGTQDYKPLLQFIKEKTGLNIQHQLEDMMFLDSLICNYDRTYSNFGVLVNRNKKFRLAPIFDSGSSFNLWRGGYGEFYRESLYLDGYLPHPFEKGFEEQLSLIRSNRQYKSDFSQFKKIFKWFIMNCSEQYNRYNVVNPLEAERIVHIHSMVKKNYIAYKRYKQTA